MFRAIRLMLAAGLLAAPLVLAPAAQARMALPGVAPPSFAPLVRQVLPAVVNIAVTETVASADAMADLPEELRDTPLGRQLRDRLNRRREQVQGAGSGFILDPSGIIVTNNHVVGHADRIIVSLLDGTELPAKLIGTDELTDIAVIKVSAGHPLPAVSFGDSGSMEVGDWILAAGNPFGLGGSITAGIISARGRDIGAGPFDDFLQIDAPINPGNSGGPTFNMAGQVIGINTAIVSPGGGSVGIGFAIPAALAAPVVQQLRSHGRIDRGWLGVSVAETHGPGVAIAGVERTGPAARAGLRPGDLVTGVNGTAVDSPRSLIRAVAAIPPGDSATLQVRRQGRDFQVPVTIGRRPDEQAG